MAVLVLSCYNPCVVDISVCPGFCGVGIFWDLVPGSIFGAAVAVQVVEKCLSEGLCGLDVDDTTFSLSGMGSGILVGSCICRRLNFTPGCLAWRSSLPSCSMPSSVGPSAMGFAVLFATIPGRLLCHACVWGGHSLGPLLVIADHL